MAPIVLRSVVAAFALLALLVAGPAQADARKPKPKRADVVAAALRAPTHAHPGGALPLDLTVKAQNKAVAKTATRFYLSADRKAGKGDVRLAGVTTPKLKAKGVSVAKAEATLAAGTRLGAWNVIACADDTKKVRERSERNNCRVATLTVAAEGTTPSAKDLIAADVKAGKLSAEKALVFRLFAEFGDHRLPAKYRGDAGAEHDETIAREASAAYATLSKTAKKQVFPFFLPPAAEGSWMNLTAKPKAKMKARAAQEEEADPGDRCDSEQLNGPNWSNIPAAGGKLRFWWLAKEKEVGEKAKTLAAEMANVAYPKFKQVMGRDVMSDANIKCFHGGDGALDVYFVPEIQKARAMSMPSAQSPNNNLICDGTPSFIVAEYHTNRWDLAHELFHSFQFLFPYQEDCRNYLWFDEGSANWGGNLAYPGDNGEHEFNAMLDNRYEWTLSDHDYESWPFALFLEKTQGPQAIKAIYEQFGKADALPAMDKAIGGFTKRWREFAKHAWNQDPVPSFQQWDGVKEHPMSNYREFDPVHLQLAGQKKRSAYPKASMDPLTREYKSYVVTDETLRELKFVNPKAGDDDFGVQAIVTVGGVKRVEDWTGKRTVTFCRDNPEQNLTALVLIYSNAKFAKNQRIDAEPEMKLRDKCDGFPYHYKILSASFNQTTYAKSSVSYPCSRLNGLTGTNEFKGQGTGPQLDPENKLEKGKYSLDGRIYAHVPASWTQTLSGCEMTPDGDLIPCQTTRVDTPRPNGDWQMGFSIRSDTPDATSAKITWTIMDPSVGYFDADNSVCNFMEQWKGFDYQDQLQDVPLEKLASTAPQTYVFTGGPKHWNATQVGQAALIQFDWSHTVTVQRVDEDGEPLE
ncbi:MAG: hypothetical protein JHC95_20905 [Solirubrobacteraceae bacterium]|nr:hypothetical protein [Solirubrobacteraceae bacterium]